MQRQENYWGDGGDDVPNIDLDDDGFPPDFPSDNEHHHKHPPAGAVGGAGAGARAAMRAEEGLGFEPMPENEEGADELGALDTGGDVFGKKEPPPPRRPVTHDLIAKLELAFGNSSRAPGTEYRGDFLEMRLSDRTTHYLHLQVYGEVVQIEEGFDKGNRIEDKKTGSRRLETAQRAREEANWVILQKIAQGFKRNPGKFKFTMVATDVTRVQGGGVLIGSNNSGGYGGGMGGGGGYGGGGMGGGMGGGGGPRQTTLDTGLNRSRDRDPSQSPSRYETVMDSSIRPATKNHNIGPPPLPGGLSSIESQQRSKSQSRGAGAPSIMVSGPGDRRVFGSHDDESRGRSHSRSRGGGGGGMLGAELNDDDEFSSTSRRESSFWDEAGLPENDPDRVRSESRARARSASPRRDDSQSNDARPAPLGPPTTFSNPKSIKVLLADKWDGRMNPTGWYMSEKLDGVRCYWTGTKMLSRTGNIYNPPKFFIEKFPKSQLDGELWTGRSEFNQTVSIVRKQNPVDSQWERVTYRVFDAPALDLPFQERYKRLQDFFRGIDSSYIKLHPHIVCQGVDHVKEEHGKVEAAGGEGLMLRDPRSRYFNGRSKTLLKVKSEHDDEAIIIGYEREAGRVKSLLVRNAAGKEFEVGSGLSNADRANPPKIGTRITYKYRGFTESGKPRFATYWRDRDNDD
jgi:DNA ligase-1